MLLVIGTVRLDPEKLDAALPVMARMITASRAEPGCLEYGYAQDVLDRGLIHVKERWSDRDALARHFASPHIAEWRAAWPRLGVGARRLVVHAIGEGEAV